MNLREIATTIAVETVDKDKLPENLRGNLQEQIVTIRHGEQTLTLLRPNVSLENDHVHIHQDGLTATDLPMEALLSELPFSDLEPGVQNTIRYWVLRTYGHEAGYEMFPDLR